MNAMKTATGLLWLLATLSLSNALYTAWSNDWQTGDEYWHYSWNERFWNTGETERVSVSNYSSPMPITVLNVWSRHTATALGLTGDSWQRFSSRLPMVA